MYQAGEVEYLVATDAIGMGLNMDVDHVAFARSASSTAGHRAAAEPAEHWRRSPGEARALVPPALLAELAHHLVEPGGTLPDELVERHVRRLDRVDGDLETLMARIAWIRTFTYVAWQRDWTRAPAHWQAETRRIEDHLSDALHERLTEAFVDRRVSLVVGAAGTAPVEVVEGAVRIGGIDVGRLRDGSFEVVGSPPPPKQVVQAVRRRLRSDLLPLLGEIEAGPDEAITFDAQGGLRWGELQLGRWTAGPDLLEPKLILSRFELFEPAERERLRARLTAWRDRTLRGLFAALHRGPREGLTPAGRGLTHAVERGLGAVPRVDVDDLVARLTDADRKALARLDLRVGLHTVYVASLLRPRPMALRGALWSLAAGRRPLVGPPPEGRTSAPADTAPEPAWRAMGFRVVGAAGGARRRVGGAVQRGPRGRPRG
jgi:ATP-dependent RNA helicase SUPV3L1/SUV3